MRPQEYEDRLGLLLWAIAKSHPVWTDSSGEKRVDETTETTVLLTSQTGTLAWGSRPIMYSSPLKGVVGK